MQLNLNPSGVTFNESEHRYFLNKKELQGITSTIIRWLFPDTYADIPEDVLQRAADHGHYVHSCIEMLPIVGTTPDCPESQQFLDLITARNLTLSECEYLVTDRKHFASKIDQVLTTDNGAIWLADTKTTSERHEPKVRAQLSIYAYFFEKQNPELKVDGIAEIWLPRPQYGTPAFIVLPRTENKIIKRMIKAYLDGEDAAEYRQYFEDEAAKLPAEYHDIVAAIAEQEQQARLIKQRTDELKATLLTVFRENGIKKFEASNLIITYIAPTTRKSVDSTKLKDSYPDIYDQCVRESEVADTIKIKLK